MSDAARSRRDGAADPPGPPPQSFEVTSAWVGLRLDRFLQAMLPRMSRASVQDAIATRVELASGLPPKASRRLVLGEVATIHPRRAGSAERPPVEIPVLARGDGWLVVDKPAGVSSVPHARRPGADAASIVNASPAHRLDRFTSGCLLLTTGAAAARHFLEAFRSREALKVYGAVVEGVPPWRRRECREALAPDPASRVPGRLRPDEGGVDAATDVEVVASSASPPTRSLVRCVPLTGRRHQVRIHLAAAGHPVVGDLLHGGDERRFIRFQLGQPLEVEPGLTPGRHLLHARTLELRTPDGSLLRAVAPWPPDFPRELTAAWRDEDASSAGS